MLHSVKRWMYDFTIFLAIAFTFPSCSFATASKSFRIHFDRIDFSGRCVYLQPIFEIENILFA